MLQSSSTSPFDNYKPYPVQEKLDPSDPLYVEYEKQQQFQRETLTAVSQEDDPSTFDLKRATQYGECTMNCSTQYVSVQCTVLHDM